MKEWRIPVATGAMRAGDRVRVVPKLNLAQRLALACPGNPRERSLS
jgi:hypothetical protein